jgi:hypothetical protein
MKLIIQNKRISATAIDSYTGPDSFISAPAEFDIERMGEYVVADGVVSIPLPSVAALIKQIDADVDAINLAVIGSRAQEYELAERHGLAYKDAGYTGTVPSSVSSWATAKGWTATQAADDIIATASQWRTAQAAIRAQRLLRKEQVRAATDSAGITAAMAAWAGFVVAIRGQLGA